MAGLPLHLPLGPETVLAFLHEGAEERPAVLLLPPFGWEDMCSHRPRRDWAEHLARQGHPVLRLDLPGTADSAGAPRDPDRLGAWLTAVTGAAAWLRTESGAGRMVALGIGLGGLVAAGALAAGAAIDDLVLWGVPARGRTLVRELSIFARLEASQFPGAPSPPEGVLAPAGYVLTEETRAALTALDLTAAPVPVRRALLLEREGMAIDSALRGHLEASGAEVEVAPGPGWAAMMAEPQEAVAPREVFARVDVWLGELASADPVSAPPAGVATTAADRFPAPRRGTLPALSLPGARERPFAVDGLFGILTEPAGAAPAAVTAVLLNAGAQRRTGPNRMWVEAARRWAARGVATLRLDLEGLGDAEGDAARYRDVAGLYVPELVAQVRTALDALEAAGLSASFALGGLCSGAYWAFHTALEDPRVTATLMLNPRVLYWDPRIDEEREARKAVKALRGESWRRLARGEISRAQLPVTARALVRQARSLPARRGVRHDHPVDPLPHALASLERRGVHSLLAFSHREPLHEELGRDGYLARLAEWPSVHLAELPGAVHTLRPLAAQVAAHALLDEALERRLAASDMHADQPHRRLHSGVSRPKEDP